MRPILLSLVVAVALLVCASAATAAVPDPKDGHYTGFTNPSDSGNETYPISFAAVTNPPDWIGWVTLFNPGGMYLPGLAHLLNSDVYPPGHDRDYWEFD